MITILLYYLYLNKKWDEIGETKKFIVFLSVIAGIPLIFQLLNIPDYGVIIFYTLLFIFRFPYLLFFHNKKLKAKKLDYTKLIDCAAYQAPDGKIWTGKRHHNVIKTIIQATGVKQVGEGYIPGFVTMAGDFVDRETAYKLVLESKQKLKGDLELDGYSKLHSEHLY